MIVGTVTERESAERLAKSYEGDWRVVSRTEQIEEEPPPPAYTTASLLQDGVARLGWSAAEIMQVAQSLFEGGFITYPRTDSSWVSPEASAAARDVIHNRYGPDFWGYHAVAVENENGAHEAIRPSDPKLEPDRLPVDSPKEQSLYRLIWLRFLAAHMRAALVRVTVVSLEKES